MTSQSLLKETVAKVYNGLYIVLVFSLCINLLMLSAPIYMLQIFDRVILSQSTDTLLLLSFIILIAILTLALLEMVRSIIMIRIGSWLDGRLAGTLLTGSIVLPFRSGQDPTTQGLRDLHLVRSFLSGSEIFPFLDSIWVPIFGACVFLLHPWLGWVAITGAIVLFSLAMLNEYLTRRLLTESNSAHLRAMQQADTAVRNADAIEAMGLMPNLLTRWSQVNSDAITIHTRAGYRSTFITSFSKFFRLLLQVILLGLGAWLVILGEITPGAMIASSILMGRALSPVEQAIVTWKSAINARGAYTRLSQLLNSMPNQASSMALPKPDGKITVEGLSYIHPGQTEPILKGINFTLAPGEALGLIGPSAAGKTTLVRLLLGNLNPRLGYVRLDGMDVSRWDPEDLGQYCGYLPQDIELFSGTVKENIARMGEGDPEKVVEAAKLADCHNMILHFANGYDTPIGENGATLSGGERQRIALARALYGNPCFLVLDEPNAHLDSLGEEALVNTIKNLREKTITLIIISHRPYVLQHVDKILVLRQGQVQDFGAREEVLSRLTENAKKVNVTEIKRHG